MTEPKFEVFTESFDDISTGIECNGQKLTYKEVANLLNKLLSENKQLIQHRKDCIDKAKWFNNEIDSLFKENKKLKQALLFYIDVATCETSSNFDKDMEKTCQAIFGCSYDDANKKYGEYEFESEILQDFQQ